MIINLNWMALAFLAATCWGIVNVLDKEILKYPRLKIDTRLLLDSGFGLLVAGILSFELSSPTFLLVTLGMCGGALVFSFNILYYRALKKADVSAISVYLQSVSVFSAIVGFMFFAERFHSDIYLGAFLIVFGAIIVGVERKENGKFTIFSGENMGGFLRYVLPASLIMSINYGLTKVLLVHSSFWEVFFWGRIGFAFTGIIVYVICRKVRQEINADIKLISVPTIYNVGLIEFLNFLGILLLTAAYSIGTITLVTTVAAIQPLIVIMVLVVIAVLSNREPLNDFSSSRRVLIVRVVAILLQVIGMFLLARSQG